jgi:hypothetical protein
MATAASRRATPSAKVMEHRRELCRERLDIERKLAGDYALMAAIEAALKRIATAAGQSFKEDFGEDGYVSASGAVAAEFKGNVPVIVTEHYLPLKASCGWRRHAVNRGTHRCTSSQKT